MLRKLFRSKAKEEQLSAQMQVYFCDMRGQTHALFASRKGRVYRVATLSEGRCRYVTLVGQKQVIESNNLSFSDETGAPVDIQQSNTDSGLFFFQRTLAF